MRSSGLVFLCALSVSAAATKCDGGSNCAEDKDRSTLLQKVAKVETERPGEDQCLGGVVGKKVGSGDVNAKDFMCANVASFTKCEQAAINAAGYCKGKFVEEKSELVSEEAGIEQAQQALEEDDDTCVNPASDNPEDWLCSCVEEMEAQCSSDPDTYDECIKNAMCQDARVEQTWKDSECPAGSPAGCTKSLLVQTSTQNEGAAIAQNNTVPDQTATSLVEQDVRESSIDESLAGKRSC